MKNAMKLLALAAVVGLVAGQPAFAAGKDKPAVTKDAKAKKHVKKHEKKKKESMKPATAPLYNN